eukprot:SAG22_NODE_1813_length_3512_cov_103.505703_3_plen_85_part_00
MPSSPCSAARRNLPLLVPLMDECLYVLNHLYDETDGREDGEATILTDAYNHCMTIAPTDLLATLKTLHDGQEHVAHGSWPLGGG